MSPTSSSTVLCIWLHCHSGPHTSHMHLTSEPQSPSEWPTFKVLFQCSSTNDVKCHVCESFSSGRTSGPQNCPRLLECREQHDRLIRFSVRQIQAHIIGLFGLISWNLWVIRPTGGQKWYNNTADSDKSPLISRFPRNLLLSCAVQGLRANKHGHPWHHSHEMWRMDGKEHFRGGKTSAGRRNKGKNESRFISCPAVISRIG